MVDLSPVYNEVELRQMTAECWDVLPQNQSPPTMQASSGDHIYEGYLAPYVGILRCPAMPLDLFYYFLPQSLWVKIAQETNRYWRDTFDSRLEAAVRRSSASAKPKSRDQIESQMMKFKKVWPHEIVQYIGLWIAHVLCPQKRMHMHWSTESCGSVPSGTFNRVMSRQRFEDISTFLHFSDNKMPEAKIDRAWKIRPVLNTLMKTFKQGYVLGYRVSLDEGMLPSRNRQ